MQAWKLEMSIIQNIEVNQDYLNLESLYEKEDEERFNFVNSTNPR
jgi:hypothetical protein